MIIPFNFGDLLPATSTLSFTERTVLVQDLLESVDEDPEYEREVIEEAERRLREYEEGRVEAIDGEEVLARLRAEIAASALTAPQREAREQIVMALEDVRREAMALPDHERLDLAYA